MDKGTTKMTAIRSSCAVFSAIAVFAALLLATSGAWARKPVDGKSIFEKRCSACHKLPEPDKPPPAGWVKQLDLMAPNARLKKDQKEAVLAYLLSHTRQATQDASLDEDRKLFEEKCSKCHTLDRIFLEPLNNESRRHVIARMQARSGTDWLSDADVKRILHYLDTSVTQAKNAKPLKRDTPAEDIFATRCSACHTLERIFNELDRAKDGANVGWSHIVSRMRGKAPQWISEDEAKEVLHYLQSNTPGPQK